MNIQGNAVIDLGCRDSQINDKGMDLSHALTSETPLTPQKVPGQENLYPILSGEELQDVPFIIELKRSRKGNVADLALQNVLMDIAPKFDLVFINLTPENLLLDLALAASRWLMIPTRTDSASIDGMRGVTDHFVQVRQTNSQIQLLRAVLFATTRNATRIHTNAYNQIERAFGSKSPSFRSFIRYSEALAQEARYPDQGKLAHELETLAKDQPAWWEALKSGEKRHRISLTTSTVSTDYSNVCLEMINIISKAEKTA